VNPLVREHTDALAAALEDLGLTVGRGKAPKNVAISDGYVTLYSIPGGNRSGTLAAPDEDATLIYQFTCVGESEEQAEGIADRALELLGTHTFEVEGRRIPRVYLVTNPGTRRNDSVTPPVFESTPRIGVMTTPGEEES
jgi:hypothetical protein